MTPCWEWKLVPGANGYAISKMRIGGTLGKYMHRVSYEWFVGPIPEGLEIDHRCFNRLCVNPEHLEPVTSAVNTQRAATRRTGREYALFYRPSQNLWIARVTLDGPGRRRREFSARTERRAAEKAEAFMAPAEGSGR